MIPVAAFQQALELETVVAPTDDELAIDTGDINRPGLQFAGFFEYFPHDCAQVLGKVEMTYLQSLSPALRRERLDRFFSYRVPVVVICRNLHCPDELVEAAVAAGTPVFRSRLVTTRFFSLALGFINACLAPQVTRHGVLIDVFGTGVLITGDSGIGKSESALELVKRGHRLCADDAVEIRQVAENRLVGTAPAMVRHLMEIRGIGIIDIKSMYGIGAVVESKTIDLVIHLELWDAAKEYDRLGLTEESTSILGVKLPKITLPVRPGRNLAIIIEVAARNQRLKSTGYNAARELEARVLHNAESE